MSDAAPPMLGLAISDPPDTELSERGLTRADVRRMFTEITGHALRSDWTVAYGGDLRAGGFTETLLDVARRRAGGRGRVTSYLAWPIWVGRADEDDAALADVATVIRCPPPAGAPDTLPPPAQRSPIDRLHAADGLRDMRQQMIPALDACVVIGGRLSGQTGLVPGIVEEAALAAMHGVALYVVGGFGGAARVVAGCLATVMPVELTSAYQIAHTPHYRDLLDAARSQGRAYDPVVALLATGLDQLANGLNAGDNQRLITTSDVDEAAALIAQGLDGLNRQHTNRSEQWQHRT